MGSDSVLTPFPPASETPSFPVVSVEKATEIASVFVNLYYQVALHKPSLLHKFYADSSVLTMPDSLHGRPDTVTSLERIKSITTVTTVFQDADLQIVTVDAQGSPQGSIAIVVSGTLKKKESGVKVFIQRFHLARPEERFFLLNDVFCFVDDLPSFSPLSDQKQPKSVPDTSTSSPASTVAVSQAVKPAKVSKVARPSTDTFKTSVPEENVTSAPPAVREQSVPLDSLEQTDALEEPATVASAASPAAGSDDLAMTPDSVKPDHPVPDEVSSEEKPKMSYAAILATLGQKKADGIEVAKTVSAKASPLVSKPSAAMASNSVADVVSDGEAFVEQSIAEEPRSIHIRNLPLHANTSDVFEAFKQFGPIKPNGIQVRVKNQVNHMFVYGFVEFESTESFHAALKMGTLIMKGYVVKIEEKRGSLNARGTLNQRINQRIPRRIFQNDGSVVGPKNTENPVSSDEPAAQPVVQAAVTLSAMAPASVPPELEPLTIESTAAMADEAGDPPVPAADSELSEERPKKSYAAIVSTLGQKKADESTAVQLSDNSAKTSPRASKAPIGQAVPPAGDGESEVDVPAEIPASEGDQRSVYVRNLPLNASVDEVHNEFKQFGAIKANGIQIRVKHQVNHTFVYGFVEFESTDSFTAAMKKGILNMKGYIVKIEEKRGSLNNPRVNVNQRSNYHIARRNFRFDGGGGSVHHGDAVAPYTGREGLPDSRSRQFYHSIGASDPAVAQRTAASNSRSGGSESLGSNVSVVSEAVAKIVRNPSEAGAATAVIPATAAGTDGDRNTKNNIIRK